MLITQLVKMRLNYQKQTVTENKPQLVEKQVAGVRAVYCRWLVEDKSQLVAGGDLLGG